MFWRLQQGPSSYGNKVQRLLLEYATEGSLNSFMNNYAEIRKLPELFTKEFTRMILEGLVSINGHGYVHCNIKPDNLLVFPSSSKKQDSSYEITISDFGNTLEVGKVPQNWNSDWPWLGTPGYMPPESLCDNVGDKTVDLWSVGCLVLEMYTGEYPWEGVDTNDLDTNLFDGKALEIAECLP